MMLDWDGGWRRSRKEEEKVKESWKKANAKTKKWLGGSFCVRCFCTWGYAFLFCALCHLSLSLSLEDWNGDGNKYGTTAALCSPFDFCRSRQGSALLSKSFFHVIPLPLAWSEAVTKIPFSTLQRVWHACLKLTWYHKFFCILFTLISPLNLWSPTSRKRSP